MIQGSQEATVAPGVTGWMKLQFRGIHRSLEGPGQPCTADGHNAQSAEGYPLAPGQARQGRHVGLQRKATERISRKRKGTERLQARREVL